MTERLLQYIWQFQHFNKQELTLQNGDSFRVIHPGLYNTDQGPDFLEAKIRIGNTLWAGHVELHIKTSDWVKHAHQTDRNYDNVILHVVWQHDQDIPGNNIPVFTLQERVSKFLLQKYSDLMNSSSFIPCGHQSANVSGIIWLNWKERLLVERLQRKSATIFTYLQQNNYHWEETFWWLLARNFGIRVNAESFEALARSLPVTILARHKNQVHQLEALLLGQAGLLEEDFEDSYPQMLKKEYLFLKHKYNLQPVPQAVHFLRMRPSAFPTIRLAQLAMLVNNSSHLFSTIKETTSIEKIKKMLSVTANDFWHYHYTFKDVSAFKPKNTGEQMINNIIINTIVPVIFSYGYLYNEQPYKDRAINWMRDVDAEINSITSGFTGFGIENRNAFDSQALIELKTGYCDKRKCLDCSIGNALLKKSVTPVNAI